MKVLIHFDADDRDKPQTLYADMTQKEYDDYQTILSDRSQANSTLYIRSRVERNGPTKEWMFRVSRTRLEIER
jgi:hypothetical protein